MVEGEKELAIVQIMERYNAADLKKEEQRP
jgi:hypothetical protein